MKKPQYNDFYIITPDKTSVLKLNILSTMQTKTFEEYYLLNKMSFVFTAVFHVCVGAHAH